MKHITGMLERTTDGTMLADEHGNVVLWNRTVKSLLGFQAGKVLGRSCYEVMREEPGFILVVGALHSGLTQLD